MNPQSPKTRAPRTLPMEPAAAALPKEAVTATDEAPPAMTNAESPAMTIIREQDRLMPVANVSRIMRQVLPPYAKISDDAKEVIQECVSEFISFVTGEANDRCHAERRKTVTSEDIVWAITRLGFDDYVEPLGTFLQRMRDSEGAEERGPGRGSRRGSSSSVLTLPPPLNGGGAPRQMHHPPAAVCRLHRPPPSHQGVSSPAGCYAVVRPVLRPVAAASGAAPAPHFGGRYLQMHGGGRPVLVPCYGGGAAFVVQAGGTQHVGFHADEASSSSNENPPAGSAGSHSH